MAKLEKCNATTYMELNKTYMRGDEKYGTKKFQAMCLIISADLDQYSGIWNNHKNITLMETDIYPKTTPDACDILCCYKETIPPD